MESLLDVLAGAAAVHLEAEVNVFLVLGQMCVQAHSRVPGIHKLVSHSKT